MTGEERQTAYGECWIGESAKDTRSTEKTPVHQNKTAKKLVSEAESIQTVVEVLKCIEEILPLCYSSI
jgi:hypothetical protein